MSDVELTRAFSQCSGDEKLNFLLRFAHELTIIARATYEVGTEELTNPSRLRAINEIQHRVTSFAIALRQEDANRYPDEVLVQIILDHPDDPELQRQLRRAFERLVSPAVTA